MLTYSVGVAPETAFGAQSLANYYQSSEHVPELQNPLGAYYADQRDSAVQGAHAVPIADMHPLVADRLGIAPGRPLTTDQLAHLLSGKRADGAEVENSRPKKNAFIDFTFSAPKSFSVALMLAPTQREREILEKAFIDASEQLARHIAREIGTASVGDTSIGRASRREPAHVAIINVDHYTARPTVKVANGRDTEIVPFNVGDPNRHRHMLIPNLAVTDSGRATAIYQEGILDRVKEWGSIGQAFLATNLRKAGVEVELDSTPGLSFDERMARLPAVPRWACDLFSKRTADGERAARELAEERGRDFDAMSPQERIDFLKRGTHRTREDKSKIGAARGTEYEEWHRQAKEANYRHRSVLRPGQEQDLRPAPERHKQAYETSLPLIEEHFERRAVIEGWVARTAAAKGLIAAGIASADEVNAITRAHRTEGVRQDGEKTLTHWAMDPERRFARITTQLSVEQETEAIGLLQAAAADKSVALSREAVDRAVAKVSAERDLDFTTPHGKAQVAFIHKLAEQGRAAVGIGVAGSGKSTALMPYLTALHEAGRDTMGITLAWRQTEGLKDAGVGKTGPKVRARKKHHWQADKTTLTDAGLDSDRVFAITPFIRGVTKGTIVPTDKTTVIIDELALVGTKQMLELARLQAKHGFAIVGIGDDKQCQSVNAGATIDLARRAFGSENVPELLSTVRQRTKRDRETAAMFREGNAADALARKEEDGTLMIVPGGYRDAVRAAVDLWFERRAANAEVPSYTLGVSVPTNADGLAIGEAIRTRRRAAGELGADLVRFDAVNQNGDAYQMTLARGDMVRLFHRVRGQNEHGHVAVVGNNGSVVEVLGADDNRVTFRSVEGQAVSATWDRLTQEGSPIRLAYGYAVTIDARQSDTVSEHITVAPAGSEALNSFKTYTAESRHRDRSWVVFSQGAEKDELMRRRPIGDPRNRETDPDVIRADVVENIARNLSRQPAKDLALDFLDRAVALRSGSVDARLATWHEPQPAGQNVVDRQREVGAEVEAVKAPDFQAIMNVVEATQNVIKVPKPDAEEVFVLSTATLVASGSLTYAQGVDDLMVRYIRTGGDLDKLDAAEARFGEMLSEATDQVEMAADMPAVIRAMRDVSSRTREEGLER